MLAHHGHVSTRHRAKEQCRESRSGWNEREQCRESRSRSGRNERGTEKGTEAAAPSVVAAVVVDNMPHALPFSNAGRRWREHVRPESGQARVQCTRPLHQHTPTALRTAHTAHTTLRKVCHARRWNHTKHIRVIGSDSVRVRVRVSLSLCVCTCACARVRAQPRQGTGLYCYPYSVDMCTGVATHDWRLLLVFDAHPGVAIPAAGAVCTQHTV